MVRFQVLPLKRSLLFLFLSSTSASNKTNNKHDKHQQTTSSQHSHNPFIRNNKTNRTENALLHHRRVRPSPHPYILHQHRLSSVGSQLLPTCLACAVSAALPDSPTYNTALLGSISDRMYKLNANQRACYCPLSWNSFWFKSTCVPSGACADKGLKSSTTTCTDFDLSSVVTGREILSLKALRRQVQRRRHRCQLAREMVR